MESNKRNSKQVKKHNMTRKAYGIVISELVKLLQLKFELSRKLTLIVRLKEANDDEFSRIPYLDLGFTHVFFFTEVIIVITLLVSLAGLRLINGGYCLLFKKSTNNNL